MSFRSFILSKLVTRVYMIVSIPVSTLTALVTLTSIKHPGPPNVEQKVGIL